MGDVVKFRPRPQLLDAEVEALVEGLRAVVNKEARRRAVTYGSADAGADLKRILALYPLFRLTHANRSRRCLFCDRRIAPLELHFVKDGSYVCQAGDCEQS